MPHYMIQEKNKTGILVYEAPLDEKTKEVRKKFDVDDETGYPRMYNWRPMARLGSDFRPEKVYEVLPSYTPEERLSTKVTIVGAMALTFGSVHFIMQKMYARPFWSKPWKTLAYFTASVATVLYISELKQQKQEFKNQIYADYMQKHPDRFETVHRPKAREVLFEYCPPR